MSKPSIPTRHQFPCRLLACGFLLRKLILWTHGMASPVWGQRAALRPHCHFRANKVVDFSACPAFYSLLLWSGDFHAQPETGSQDFVHLGKSLDQGLHLAQVPGSPSSKGTCANTRSLQSCRSRCQGGRTEALGAGTSPESHWGGPSSTEWEVDSKFLPHVP